MYIEKQMTYFYHVHDEDFEIKPYEPKLVIAVLCFGRNRTKTRVNSFFLRISEAVDYVTVTVIPCTILICKICMRLRDSGKTGILNYHLARFALSCKILAILASANKKIARITFFIGNCKISARFQNLSD